CRLCPWPLQVRSFAAIIGVAPSMLRLESAILAFDVGSMALIVFRSKAAGEIYMFEETAQRLLDIIGKADLPRGVITAEQVPDALARLVAAVEAEKAQQAESAREREEAERRGETPAAE